MAFETRTTLPGSQTVQRHGLTPVEPWRWMTTFM